MTSVSSGNSTVHKDPGDMAPRGPRPLGTANFQWWRSTHGLRYEAAASVSVLREPKRDLLDAFFSAIRGNQVGRVCEILDVYPHLAFTKCFGVEQRTALYTASFFARHEIVSLLLQRGVDSSRLYSEGVQPSGVVGYGRRNAVDEMKVRCLLSEKKELHVLILCADEGQVAVVPTASRRVHIHFSEAVEDFIQEDLEANNCAIERFTQLGPDFYAVSVRLAKQDSLDSSPATIQVPGGVIRAHDGSITNTASKVFKLTVRLA